MWMFLVLREKPLCYCCHVMARLKPISKNDCAQSLSVKTVDLMIRACFYVKTVGLAGKSKKNGSCKTLTVKNVGLLSLPAASYP